MRAVAARRARGRQRGRTGGFVSKFDAIQNTLRISRGLLDGYSWPTRSARAGFVAGGDWKVGREKVV